jgi:hypothetical protein
MSEPVIAAPEELNARRRRNLWIALSIGAFVVLVFLITVAKLQANLLERPL